MKRVYSQRTLEVAALRKIQCFSHHRWGQSFSPGFVTNVLVGSWIADYILMGESVVKVCYK